MKIIVVKIMGGLGNQLFQYALGRAHSLKTGRKLFLDTSWYNSQNKRKFLLDNFNLRVDIANERIINNFISNKRRLLLKFLLNQHRMIYEEELFNFDSSIFQLKGNIYLNGYWQNENYFLDHRKTIVHDFKLKNHLSNENDSILDDVKNSNSVSIHIRRGDIAEDSKLNEKIGTVPLNYYKKAVDDISKYHDNLKFFIFSDNITWTKKNFKINQNHSYVADNSPQYDMFLMINCKHNIIANSTYSWWGAWLNENTNKKIYAPKIWFKDKLLQKSYFYFAAKLAQTIENLKLKMISYIYFGLINRFKYYKLILFSFLMSDKKYIENRFYESFGRKIDLKAVKTFNEKLQWLKLYDRKKLHQDLVDKFKVRSYVSKKISKEYLNNIFGVYYDFESFDRDYSNLPDSFIIKASHASGWNYFVDKSTVNKKHYE